MKQIYLDNAATTFPKPPAVPAAVQDYMCHVGCNVNRGGYASAYSAAEVLMDLRERLCHFFGGPSTRNVVFTANVTMSLNMLIKGLLRPGDHVLTSSMEHNAVMRPLRQMEEAGVELECVPCDSCGRLQAADVERRLRPNTRAVVMTHASNVSGTLLPVAEVGAICRRHGVFLLVDSAQTAGVEDIDMAAMCIDGLAFTGHKGLLGPQGTGGFIVTDALAAALTPLLSGGTGSFSHLETMPAQLPDRFEAGTANLPGLYGLHAAICFLQSQDRSALRQKERALAQRLADQIEDLSSLRIVGPKQDRTAVVSVDFLNQDNAQAAFRLEQEYGILTRCGLHCAPRAHQTLGTYPQGTVRFSFGIYNTEEETDFAARAIRAIAADGV